MIDIASLIALCQTALTSGSKLIASYKKKKLSAPERELLTAAAQQGTFYILSVNEIPGSWVRVGGNDFVDTAGDPAFAARYLEAFRNLCERGYIHHESGVLFKLTGTGFEKARELSA
jgi:hypothetical protein